MSCNVLNLQWLFKQWTTCVEEKRVVVRGFGCTLVAVVLLCYYYLVIQYSISSGFTQVW